MAKFFGFSSYDTSLAVYATAKNSTSISKKLLALDQIKQEMEETRGEQRRVYGKVKNITVALMPGKTEGSSLAAFEAAELFGENFVDQLLSLPVDLVEKKLHSTFLKLHEEELSRIGGSYNPQEMAAYKAQLQEVMLEPGVSASTKETAKSLYMVTQDHQSRHLEEALLNFKHNTDEKLGACLELLLDSRAQSGVDFLHLANGQMINYELLKDLKDRLETIDPEQKNVFLQEWMEKNIGNLADKNDLLNLINGIEGLKDIFKKGFGGLETKINTALKANKPTQLKQKISELKKTIKLCNNIEKFGQMIGNKTVEGVGVVGGGLLTANLAITEFMGAGAGVALAVPMLNMAVAVGLAIGGIVTFFSKKKNPDTLSLYLNTINQNILALQELVAERFDDLSFMIKGLDTHLEDIKNKLDEIKTHIDARFDTIEERLDGLAFYANSESKKSLYLALNYDAEADYDDTVCRAHLSRLYSYMMAEGRVLESNVCFATADPTKSFYLSKHLPKLSLRQAYGFAAKELGLAPEKIRMLQDLDLWEQAAAQYGVLLDHYLAHNPSDEAIEMLRKQLINGIAALKTNEEMVLLLKAETKVSNEKWLHALNQYLKESVSLSKEITATVNTQIAESFKHVKDIYEDKYNYFTRTKQEAAAAFNFISTTWNVWSKSPSPGDVTALPVRDIKACEQLLEAYANELRSPALALIEAKDFEDYVLQATTLKIEPRTRFTYLQPKAAELNIPLLAAPIFKVLEEQGLADLLQSYHLLEALDLGHWEILGKEASDATNRLYFEVAFRHKDGSKDVLGLVAANYHNYGLKLAAGGMAQILSGYGIAKNEATAPINWTRYSTTGLALLHLLGGMSYLPTVGEEEIAGLYEKANNCVAAWRFGHIERSYQQVFKTMHSKHCERLIPLNEAYYRILLFAKLCAFDDFEEWFALRAWNTDKIFYAFDQMARLQAHDLRVSFSSISKEHLLKYFKLSRKLSPAPKAGESIWDVVGEFEIANRLKSFETRIADKRLSVRISSSEAESALAIDSKPSPSLLFRGSELISENPKTALAATIVGGGLAFAAGYAAFVRSKESSETKNKHALVKK
jgi:hypothetical protein